jgi:mannose-6-phosphate isomerase-like protein (cupin superfamily)
MDMNPYSQVNEGGEIIRTFDENVDGHELVWHRDKRDRVVRVLEGNGWWFQMDNSLPLELKVGTEVEIPKETYHRVIKGDTPLKIKITE